MKLTRRQKNRSNLVRRTRKQRILNHPAVRQFSQDLWIRAAKQGRTYRPRWRMMHAGGEVSASGYTFIYNEEDDGTLVCISKKQDICFKIVFDEELKTIGISIGYYPECSTRILPEEGGTLIMLQAILKLILNNPAFPTFKKIVIDDMSYKSIISHEDGLVYRTRLMDMYFACTGCTWYGSLIPMFLSNVNDDKNYEQQRCRIIECDVDTSYANYELPNDYHEKPMRWGTFLRRLPAAAQNYILDLADGENDEPASAVLNRIREGRKYGIIFHKFMDDILLAFGVSSLYGKEWMIPLREGKFLVPTNSSCKNRKEQIIPDAFIERISNKEYTKIKETIQYKRTYKYTDAEVENILSLNIDTRTRLYNPTAELDSAEDLSFNENNNVSSLSNLDALLMRR